MGLTEFIVEMQKTEHTFTHMKLDLISSWDLWCIAAGKLEMQQHGYRVIARKALMLAEDICPLSAS